MLRPALIAAVLAAALATSGVHAQATPPIKTGLWEIAMTDAAGQMQQMQKQMAEMLKNLPPEQRKQMEAQLKQQGVQMPGADGHIRSCVTQEMLDQNQWQGQQGQCKTDVTSRSATLWKWHTVCTQPAVDMQGEATFHNPEHYTVVSSGKGPDGQPMRMTMVGKWKGADCGDLKPARPPSKGQR